MADVDVVVGRIGRPHGIRGAVQIELRTDEPERRFAPGAVLHLVRSVVARPGTRAADPDLTGAGLLASERTLEVGDVRWHQGRLLVTFAGFADRTEIETLRGALLVARVGGTETPSEPGEYYDRQLVGLAVLDAGGTEVGRVVEVVHLPSQDLLSVDVAGGSRLVPFVAALVPEVDLVAGHVRLAEVEGLLHDPDA